MRKQDRIIIIGVACVAAIFSFVLSGAIFGSPQRNPISVPVVKPINPLFPQVNNDTNYSSFFNNKALDPAQLIQIGNSSNSQPFNSSSQ